MLQLSQRPLTGSKADGRLFVGRDVELRRLERAAQLDFNVLALGERGVGLTSLMRRHQRRMEDAGRRCFYLSGTKIEGSEQVFDAIWTGGKVRNDALSSVRKGLGVPQTDSVFHELVRKINREADNVPLVFLDDMRDPKLTHRMFGRYRDEMWELPCRWVVCGLIRHRSEYLTPPADAFFEAEIVVGPVDDSVAGDLLGARLATAKGGEVRAAELIRSNYGQIVKEGGGNPRRILASARDAALRDVGETARREHSRRRAAKLGGTEGRVLQYLFTRGPASASDEELLDHFGITRARATQVLGRLEEARLVAAHYEKQSAGRPRKVYRAEPPGNSAKS